jgi:signal transduction histidine kinase/ActR/RegA family two-component response regulator
MTRAPALLQPVLERQRDDIIRRFVGAVQHQDLPPEGTARSLLIDHLPHFLDELIAELGESRAVRDSQDAFDTSQTAREHGGQRWTLGYDIAALVREYGVLRHCILEAVKDAGATLGIDEFDTLAKCLNVGVAEATAAYVAHRDEELVAQQQRLELLVEAGKVLTASLDAGETLAALTRLLVPRTADCAVIQLGGHDAGHPAVAHLDPSRAERVRELYRSDSPGAAAPLDARALEASRLVPEVTSWDPPSDMPLLRALDVRSWLTVPLRLADGARGAILLGLTDPKRRYDEHDLALAEELARRLSVAMDNARLYALSLAERSRVEETTRAKDHFVAMISHELRTPLNAVLGWTRMLRTNSLPTTKTEHALEVIERNTLAQNQLIDDLLDISRIITGNMRIQRTYLNGPAAVEMAVESVRPLAEGKGIRLDLALDSGEQQLFADAERFRQIVVNLLTNAVKFTPRSGTVRVSFHRLEASWELQVTDDGAGISADFLPHVFEHFRQSQAGTTRATGGLGIGLAIVKHLVLLHGGSAEAQSAGLGRGATFTVRLPATPQADVTPETRTDVLRASGDFARPSGLEGLRVLVIEDEPDARDLLATILETCGVHVRTARTAADALRQLEEVSPDVIISDIGLPGDDGYSLIESIRKLESEGKHVPALALTAYARTEDRNRALAAGFTAYATKPIEPSALLAQVAELSGRANRLDSSGSTSPDE